MKVHIVIEKDEKGYFVAEVPALSGCLSQRKTYEEAVSNIGEAIKVGLKQWSPENPSMQASLWKLPYDRREAETLLWS